VARCGSHIVLILRLSRVMTIAWVAVPVWCRRALRAVGGPGGEIADV
jgi:hypothetical protein